MTNTERKVIKAKVGLSPATVSRIMGRARLSRARDLDPPPPVLRRQHDAPPHFC